MITFLAALCGGLVSAVIALTLGQPLQHYFWTRQRQAERQLAVIEEVRTLVAELQFLVGRNPEEIGARREQLYTGLHKAVTGVVSLFSDTAFESFRPVVRTMDNIIHMGAASPREERLQLHDQLIDAVRGALAALYQEVGIPAPTLSQWLHRQVGQPLRAQVWDHPRRYWRERGRPGLQQWAAQVRTMNRRLCAGQPRAMSDEDRS